MSENSLHPGDRVDRYRVEALIGAGGMGEVYRAHDQALGRAVALKVLPIGRIDEERVRRFVAEAQNASRLKHPSIVTVHDSGRSHSNGSSVYYLAMELVEGEMLSALTARRDLPKALEVMAQVAEGLAAAHANGIIHRDLKPENIVVSRDGYAKILDFGISKLIESTALHDDRTTDPAVILGTVGYMSPEQVTGGAVDARSDIFSFGAVLYELVCGTPAFDGASPVDTLHSILHRQPPLPEHLPRELTRILRKCLANDRDERYHSIKDVALDLRDLARELRAIPITLAAASRPRTWIIAAASLLALVALAVIRLTWFEDPPAAPSSVRMARLTFSGNVWSTAIAPDGNYIVYSVRDRDGDALWVKQVATGSLFRLTQHKLGYYGWIRISPDGNYVYFQSMERRDPNVIDLHQIPLLGGESRKVLSNIDGSFCISPDGKSIAFVRFNAAERQPRLFVANVATGEERLLLKRPEGFIGASSWAPDGKSIAFVSFPARKDGKRRIEQVKLSDGSTSQLIPNTFGRVIAAQWLPDGAGLVITAANSDEPPQLWFAPYPSGDPRKITNEIVAYDDVSVARDGRSVLALRLDASSNLMVIDTTSRSPARPITTGLANLYGMGGDLEWTNDGRIIFTSWEGGSPYLCELPAPAGSTEPATVVRHLTRGRDIEDIAVSPTDSKFAYVSDSSGPREVWISNLDGSAARQVTQNGQTECPSFFPDGKSIAYVGISAQKQFAYRMSLADGTTQQLTNKPTHNTHVSPDGKWLLCRYRDPEPGKPLWRTALIPLTKTEGISAPERLFELPRYGGSPRLRWMPDGKAFSFVDWKDGIANVWIQPLAGDEPRQATFFDSGSIYSFDWSPDASRLVVSHGNPIGDAVLITGFR
jgi:eukaryotic-like serine/threonine-protein kinase